MNVRNIEQPARGLLNDAKTPYRWKSDDIIAGVDEGEALLVGERPELVLSDENTIGTRTSPTTLTSNLTVPDRFKPALIQYVVYFCLQFRAEDKAERENAAVHLAEFERLVKIL